MIEIRHVLCPVDFSDFARRALDHAIAVARRYRSRLTVLYVHHVPVGATALALAPGLPSAPALQVPVLLPGEREQLRRELEAFVPAHAMTDISVEFCIAEGDVAGEIVAQAQSADLVVMGTHGRSGFEHLVLGSVTEKLLRKARCPLLTIPRATPDATQGVPALFHHILAAVDFSEPSMHALTFALSLAEEADAHLTMLHVLDIPPHLALWLEGGHGRASYVNQWRELALERLRAAVPESARVHSHVEERVETGKPHDEILRVAAERHAGLIVVGAHGRGVVERMFVGSTAEHLVRQAVCPVLTVRRS